MTRLSKHDSYVAALPISAINPETEPTKPGHEWFVYVEREGRGRRAVAGPFSTAAEANRIVPAARTACGKMDPWTHFDTFGILEAPRDTVGVVPEISRRVMAAVEGAI